MARYLFSRLTQSVFVLWAVVTLAFFMIKATPGNPFASDKAASKYVIEQNNKAFGLDRPLSEQYVKYLGNLLRGDLGWSFKFEGRSVREIIGEGFPISLKLGSLSLLMALGLGVPIGLYSAVRKNRWQDHLLMALAMLGICLPTFVSGPALAMIFGLKLGWFNVAGLYEWSDWVLPAATLGLVYTAGFARMTREGMLEALSQDFIRTARAKGVPGWQIVVKHALRPALLPLLSVLGPAVAGLVVGSLVVETVFKIPGLGQHFTEAIMNKDYSLVLGTVAFYCAFIVAANLIVDVLQVLFNPRLKFSNE